jgi:hypothetical protein
MQQGTVITSKVWCETLKEQHRAIQNKRHGILTSSSLVVLLHDNVLLHTSTADRTQALLEHFNWELFDHSPYSPDLTPNDYHLFTYLKHWLDHSTSKIKNCWNMSKRGWAHRWHTSLTQGYRNLFPDKTCASIPAVTTLRSNLSMYIFFVHNEIFFSSHLFC